MVFKGHHWSGQLSPQVPESEGTGSAGLASNWA
jgi:hypothetical protein